MATPLKKPGRKRKLDEESVNVLVKAPTGKHGNRWKVWCG